ncbi:MAG TPA: S9 family peptidase, partial [Planctomycetota bacterium]|nr:S9 family peptidase [Planctomycetota bacterium]
MRIVLSALVLASTVTAAPAQEKRGFSVDDMLAMERISDAQVSPDGAWVAYNLRTTDLAANKGRTDVWIARTDGSATRRITANDATDVNARWMPDGKSLVFLSSRSGTMQVWRVAIDGGEPTQQSKFPLDVTNLAVFPDGERLLVTLDVHPKTKTLDESKKRDDEKAAKKASGMLFDQLMMRHWDGWEDGKRSHVFAWKIGSDAPIDLMAGMDVDSPIQPFGGSEDLAISADSKWVVFAAKNVGREDAWSTNNDIWKVPSDGSAAPVCLTKANQGQDGAPSFSPDGKQLAWLAMERPGFEADAQVVQLMAWPDGAPRALTKAWDRSASEISWSKDGATIYTSADDLGQKSIFAIDVASGAAKKLVGTGTNASPARAGERIVFLQDTLRMPVEIFTCKLDGSDVQRVTHVNDAKLANVALGDFEQFTFPGANNETVHGFVLKPAKFDAAKKYPVAFLIHGGPQGSFGNHFHYRWNPQAYAGAGFAAVFIDFHGSTGYGQAFTDAIRGDWGGKPYEDLMKGLDFALAKYSFLDKDKLTALGASYGGYMINWIAGQTDRFKALVCHDGNLDERMAYFDTEELWFPEWEHHGAPWEEGSSYAKHNPIDFVSKWKTPMLVIHGGRDYRVVDTQGMSTFTAL